MTDLTTLLAIQEHDTAVDRLAYRRETLPEKNELAAVGRELDELIVARDDRNRRRQAAEEAQTAAERELATLDSRRELLEKQLYAGTVTAAKDLQAMAREVEHLKERRRSAEDRVLETMEVVESIETEESSQDASRQAAEQQATALRAAIAEAEKVIDSEIAAERQVRDAAAQAVPSDLMARYESLRKRLGGVAIARLLGGRCEGCHLTLPAAELDRIRHRAENTLVTCEECGRILVAD